MNAYESLETLFGELDRATNLQAVKALLDRELRRRGFGSFAYVQLRPPLGRTTRLYLGTYPQEWSDHYRVAALQRCDPLYSWATGALRPFLWENIRAAQGTKQSEREVFGPASELGLRSGGGIPIHGPNGAAATLQIASDTDAASFRGTFAAQGQELQLIAIRAHERTLALVEQSPAPTHQLTPRELEVLRLLTLGESNRKIAVTLKITMNTVSQHVKSIFEKVHANNRTEASVAAITKGIIQADDHSGQRNLFYSQA